MQGSNSDKMSQELEKQLLEQGFEAWGPVPISDLNGHLKYLFSREPKPTYLQIIQGKLCRNDMNNYPELYMIYLK